jgi:hypothetical protein
MTPAKGPEFGWTSDSGSVYKLSKKMSNYILYSKYKTIYRTARRISTLVVFFGMKLKNTVANDRGIRYPSSRFRDGAHREWLSTKVGLSVAWPIASASAVTMLTS